MTVWLSGHACIHAQIHTCVHVCIRAYMHTRMCGCSHHRRTLPGALLSRTAGLAATTHYARTNQHTQAEGSVCLCSSFTIHSAEEQPDCIAPRARSRATANHTPLT